MLCDMVAQGVDLPPVCACSLHVLPLMNGFSLSALNSAFSTKILILKITVSKMHVEYVHTQHWDGIQTKS